MKQTITEKLENAREKAQLCQVIIQQLVRSGEYHVVSLDAEELPEEERDGEVMEQAAILAEIAADYSEIIKELLELNAEDDA